MTASLATPGAFTDDDPDGTAWALVAVTGVRDDVGDVITPGAFRRTLRARQVKGVLGHSWNRPVARAEHVEELMPGDPRLPATLSDGVTPWPGAAGALLVKARFVLGTQDGRDAYEHARFYGTNHGFSIGYKAGKTRTVGGVRHIDDLDLYEFSPVLHGANRHARLLAVKSASRPAGMEVKATPRGASAPPAAGRRKIFPLTCGICLTTTGVADRALPSGSRYVCGDCAKADPLVDYFAEPDLGNPAAPSRAVLSVEDIAEAARLTSEGEYDDAVDGEQEMDVERDGTPVRAGSRASAWRP